MTTTSTTTATRTADTLEKAERLAILLREVTTLFDDLDMAGKHGCDPAALADLRECANTELVEQMAAADRA